MVDLIIVKEHYDWPRKYDAHKILWGMSPLDNELLKSQGLFFKLTMSFNLESAFAQPIIGNPMRKVW